MIPPNRCRLRRGRNVDPGNANALAGCEEQRALPTRSRHPSEPSLPRQPRRVRARVPRSPAHRRTPRIDRRRPYTTTEALPCSPVPVPSDPSSGHLGDPSLRDHRRWSESLLQFLLLTLSYRSCATSTSCSMSAPLQWLPRPRRSELGKSVIPTTRMTSWRAGSRDHARLESPVLAGAGATRSPARRAGLSAGLCAGPTAVGVPRGTTARKHHQDAPMSAPRARASRSAAGWSGRIWNPLRWGLAVASHPIALVSASSSRAATAH